jgi:hypothetical protein
MDLSELEIGWRIEEGTEVARTISSHGSVDRLTQGQDRRGVVESKEER